MSLSWSCSNTKWRQGFLGEGWSGATSTTKSVIVQTVAQSNAGTTATHCQCKGSMEDVQQTGGWKYHSKLAVKKCLCLKNMVNGAVSYIYYVAQQLPIGCREFNAVNQFTTKWLKWIEWNTVKEKVWKVVLKRESVLSCSFNVSWIDRNIASIGSNITK